MFDGIGGDKMSKIEILRDELNEVYNDTVETITNFKDEFFDKDYKSIKKAKNYLKWLKLKTELISNESNFEIPEEKRPFIRRTYVHWIHFGFNVGKEFGGHHPAVILSVKGDSVFVLPLSSGSIPEEKKDKPYCVEIPHVFDLPPMKRWGNVYRIVCVSKMRIDFFSKHGRVQGNYMDRINEAIEASGIKLI